LIPELGGGAPTADFDLQCSLKGKDCRYTKSNRGGPRVSRKDPEKKKQQNRISIPLFNGRLQAPSEFAQRPYDEAYGQIVANMISPGAGLKDLDSDQLFEGLFGADTTVSIEEHVRGDSRESASREEPYIPILRSYKSDEDM